MASVYNTILDAVAAQMTTVAGLTAPGQVKKRKRPVYIKEYDPLPLLCVCPRAERVLAYVQNGDVFIRYPVVLALVRQQPLDFGDVAFELDTRELIRLKLSHETLTGASTVFNFDYDPEPVFDLSGLDASVDVSMQEFVFTSRDVKAG